MDYFATFVSGAQGVIAQRLAAFSRQELTVKEVHDGLVVFTSGLSTNQLSELRFFTNVYELLSEPAAMPRSAAELRIPRLRGTCAIIMSDGNQPVSMPEALREGIVRQSGATLSAYKPDTTLLLLKRHDDRVLWGRLLPKAGFKLRHVEQGELRPEVAHTLGLVASLNSKHRLLDPFAGYGGIVREALQGFHAEQVIAVEHNEHLIPHLKSIPRLVALHGDARQLAHIHTRSIDRIITDPPWGDFSGLNRPALYKLYYEACQQMHRVLRAKGAAVILTAAPFLPHTAADTKFDIIKQINILVNGRKASIYKLRKIG